MMIGSHHWTGQLGPCPCGSAQPFAACHLRWHTGPCACESGRYFADCHRVDPTTAKARRYVRAHAADFYDTQAELVASYRRARPTRAPDRRRCSWFPHGSSGAADSPRSTARQSDGR